MYLDPRCLMAEPPGPTRPNVAARNDENRLKYACDAGILTDDFNANDLDGEDSNSTPSFDSESCKSPRLEDLAASLRVFSESLARMDLAETEMTRARETWRCEAEKRRMELEAELTRLMLGTQLQIALIVAGKGPSKKRKRAEEMEDESGISPRQRALLLSLLQCNFSF
ncbi:hypothetical protein P3X46_033480 [Hevea brasiliensis]|uniref:GTD-binding domain-containing protein n=1 Tax=Hevea brasiliensis TaxID=3981 RepID=A0ABQ9KHS1_HEVBR|nr:uncharacterized protein LOC110668710 [Hevea brasiliensis]KAJ9136396.1 hypothetical protein P3X46_033480 [Hevea brasiliensis]